MTNSIQIQYCKVEKDIKCNRIYTPIDITKNTTIPMLINLNLDTELDSAKLELLIRSNKENPFEPITRFIIRINESEDIETEPLFDESWRIFTAEKQDGSTTIWATQNGKGHKKIFSYTKLNGSIVSKLNKQFVLYRVVDFDIPIKIVLGKKPIYRHTVKLTETSKLFERVDTDNETITHTLISDAFMVSKSAVGYSSSSEIQQIQFPSTPYKDARIDDKGYASSERFKQPYRVGDVISLKPRLLIKGMVLAPLMNTTIWEEACTLSLTGLTINGKTISVNTETYKFESAGKYTIQQTYTGTKTYYYNYKFVATWVITVWDVNSSYIRKRTLADVIDKLLSTNPLRRTGIDASKFELDANIKDKLNQISAPEFSFPSSTLMDNLSQVAGFIHAEPRLLPNEYLDYKDGEPIINDWQNWNIVSFDFLGEYETFKLNSLFLQEAYWGIGDYASNFVTNIQNALQTNYRSYTSAVEPFIGGFIAPRTESSNFILTDDNCIVRTSLPIYKIIKFEICRDGNVIDGTNNILEYNKYITKSNYSVTEESKACYLYYKKGSNIIEGLNYRPDTALNIEQNLNDERAIINIINLGDSRYTGYIKDLSFRITYIPYRNFKVRQYKPLIGNNEHSTLIYNQQSNVVDLESYGENMKGALLRTGNPTFTRTCNFNKFEDIPQIGMVTTDYNYWVYSVAIEIYNNIYKCTLQLSKDFNKLNEYIGIKSDYRQYEISESDSEDRNPDHGEFCILSTHADSENLESNSEEYVEELKDFKNYLQNLGFTDYAIGQMKNKLSYISNEGQQGQQISFTYIETDSVQYDSKGDSKQIKHKILMPVSCSSFGNSIIMNFKMQDNYSAGSSLKNLSGAKAVEEAAEYGDDYGHVDSLGVAFGIGIPSNDFSVNNVKTYSKSIYKFDNYALKKDNLVVDIRNNPYWIDKDSREALNFTYQLHFVTNSKKIQIGKALSEIWGFVGDNESTLKIVEFKIMPNKFENNITDKSIYTIPTYSNAITQSTDLKRLKISAPIKSSDEHIGWGILTDDDRIVFTMEGFEDLFLMFRPKI